MSKDCQSATKGGPQGKKFSKFCSFCKSKGLPEEAFTSHFVKDQPGSKGKVCCPELLKNECGYCHDIGHTPKFCPKLKARDARRKKAKAAKARAAKARNADGLAPTLKVTNMFEALVGYATPEKPKEEFPALPGKPKKSHKVTPKGVWGGFANMSIAELEKVLADKKQAKTVAENIAKEEVVPFAAEAAAAQAIADQVTGKPELDEIVLDPARDFADGNNTGCWGDSDGDCYD
jgi:hypothetical protein